MKSPKDTAVQKLRDKFKERKQLAKAKREKQPPISMDDLTFFIESKISDSIREDKEREIESASKIEQFKKMAKLDANNFILLMCVSVSVFFNIVLIIHALVK